MPSSTPLTELLEEAFPRQGSSEHVEPGQSLRSCIARRDAPERARILVEVWELLDRGLCDMQMSELIAFELGCHVRPAEMGLTPSEWLGWVGRQVASNNPDAPRASMRDDLPELKSSAVE